MISITIHTDQLHKKAPKFKHAHHDGFSVLKIQGESDDVNIFFDYKDNVNEMIKELIEIRDKLPYRPIKTDNESGKEN